MLFTKSTSLNLSHTLTASAFTLIAMGAFATEDKTTPKTPEITETLVVTGQRSYYDSKAMSATRMHLPILETPQSIFVINADLIADQQAFRFDQVLQNDASVQKSNNFLGAYSSYQIRGFLLSNSTNYFRDGRTFFHLASVPVEVLERVEVLKGPASVLYGTLTPGGIINMTPKRPQNHQQTSLKATYGSYDFKHLHVDHGGPLTNNGDLRYRVNGVYENSNSFREFSDGSPFATERAIVAAALDWEASDSTLVRFNADYTKDDRPQDIGIVSTNGNLSALDRDLIINQPWSFYNSEVANFFAELNHEFTDQIRLRTGISYQDYMRDRYDNQFRGLPDEAGDVSIRARHRINRWDFTTYYADLIGKFTTGPVAHQILFGIDKTSVGRNNNETARNFNFTTNIFRPTVIPDPMISTSADKNLGSEDRTGVTLQNVMSVGEHWRAIVGGRFDEYKSAFSIAGEPLDGQPDADNFTPRAGLVYLPTQQLSFYTSYSESFEPNAAVDQAYQNAGQTLDPTFGEGWEFGFKWESQGGKLLTSGALFNTERIGAPVEDASGEVIVQRGLEQHDGLEWTITGLLSESVTLHGAATYLDADIDGNTPVGVAEWSISLTSEYEFFSDLFRGLSIQAGLFHESERPVDDANTYNLDSYVRIDLGAKYVVERSSGADYIFRLSAININDAQYYKASGIAAINPEAPREVRASIEIAF